MIVFRLQTKWPQLRKPDQQHLDCIELAVEANNSKFMSHPAAQGTLLHEWYGTLDSSMSSLAIIVNMLTFGLFSKLFRIKLSFRLNHVQVHKRAYDKLNPVAVQTDSEKPPKAGRLYLLKALYEAPITKVNKRLSLTYLR